MKQLPLFAATLSLAALGAAVAVSPAARADDSNPPANSVPTQIAPAIPPTSVTTTDSTNATTSSVSASSSSAVMPAQSNAPVVVPSDTTGKPVVIVPMHASAMDQWRASWAYRNLDEREVKRYRAMGFSDHTIRGAANIAMRTGVSVEYVLRQIREMGEPLAYIASEDGISASSVNADIPGYGLETISVMTTPPTPPSAPMIQRSGMINTYDSTSSTAATNSSTNGAASSASLPNPSTSSTDTNSGANSNAAPAPAPAAP